MGKKKVVEEEIYNFDIIEYFRTGEKVRVEYGYFDSGVDCGIRENILYEYMGSKDNKIQPIAIKLSDGTILFNGDENTNEELLDMFKDKVTTSLTCFQHAGMDLNDIQVIDFTDDESKCADKGEDDFDDFIVPQGAYYWEEKYGDWSSNLGDNKPDDIYRKNWHRAGCLLIKCNNKSYICGIDDDSYFVSKLRTNPTVIDEAFKSLKPKRVIEYEDKIGKQALRQGEWFFVPADDMEATNMKKKALPVDSKQSNKHVVSRYEKASNGRHYCKGVVSHTEHGSLRLGETLHEAICNTALGSWSVQGVD